MDLQELISRGRFAFSGAPERLKVYKLVDGRRTAIDLAALTNRQGINPLRHRDGKSRTFGRLEAGVATIVRGVSARQVYKYPQKYPFGGPDGRNSARGTFPERRRLRGAPRDNITSGDKSSQSLA